MNLTKANYEYFSVRNLAGDIMEEVQRAGLLFAPMNSPHEAMAVILEEYQEYQLEVFKHNTSKPDRDTRPRQREELIQLAAMCMRAILDTIDKPDFYEDYAARARKEYDLTKGAETCTTQHTPAAPGSVDEALQNIYVKHIKEDLKSKQLDLFFER